MKHVKACFITSNKIYQLQSKGREQLLPRFGHASLGSQRSHAHTGKRERGTKIPKCENACTLQTSLFLSAITIVHCQDLDLNQNQGHHKIE